MMRLMMSGSAAKTAQLLGAGSCCQVPHALKSSAFEAGHAELGPLRARGAHFNHATLCARQTALAKRPHARAARHALPSPIDALLWAAVSSKDAAHRRHLTRAMEPPQLAELRAARTPQAQLAAAERFCTGFAFRSAQSDAPLIAELAAAFGGAHRCLGRAAACCVRHLPSVPRCRCRALRGAGAAGRAARQGLPG